MRKFLIALTVIANVMLLGTCLSWADDLLKQFTAEYPSSLYLLGVAEVKQKGSDFVAYRVAEIHAKRDIAHQIRERVESSSVDYACSNATSKSFSESECRDEYISIIQVTSDEYLSGTRVVDKGKREGNVYVVVVMPKVEMADQLREKMNASIDETRALARTAKESGDSQQADEARRAMVKAKAMKGQLETFEKIDKNASDAFDMLDSQIDAF